MGVHVNNIIVNDPDDKVVAAFNFSNNIEDSRCLILASRNGMIKRTLVKELNISKLTKISTVMNLDDGDLLISCDIASSSDTTNQTVVTITENGMGLSYPLEQISVVSRTAAGVRNISLRDDDKVASIFIGDDHAEFVLIATKQGCKRIRKELINQGSRANVGKSLINQSKSNPFIVINAFPTNANDIIHMTNIDGV
jgi:topoisomerase-4 subunit A